MDYADKIRDTVTRAHQEGARATSARIRRELKAWLDAETEGEPGVMSIHTQRFGALIDRVCPEAADAEPAPGSCAWTQQDHCGGDCWETGCGNAFCMSDGTPGENGLKFCCYCGKPLAEERFVDDPEEEEAPEGAP
jgi:hypothetical protein